MMITLDQNLIIHFPINLFFLISENTSFKFSKLISFVINSFAKNLLSSISFKYLLISLDG